MKIAILATSPRDGSNSLKAAKYLQHLLSNVGYTEVGLFDFRELDIPLVGRGELDKNHLSPAQAKLLSIWKPAELVFFVVPEYNWITGGELINALHQLGSHDFADLFDDKVFAFTGVSNGRGGRRPCLEISVILNKLISILGGYGVISPKIFESHETQLNLDADGVFIGNPIYEKSAREFVDYSLTIADRWHQLTPVAK